MARGNRTTETVAPISLVLLSTYGFIDDWGDRWHWQAGNIVRNPYVVSLLLERGAPTQEV